MPITFHTDHIDKVKYTKIIRRTVILNADNGSTLSGYEYLQKFLSEWDVHVIPVGKEEEYKRFYEHIKLKTSDGIAWGITGKKKMFLFVVDSVNPFIIRSNAMPIGHEILHAIYQDNVGTFHITRKYDAPEGRAGTQGPAATVIVHDNWYGSKISMRIWLRWGIIWIPINIPYQPLFKSKENYAI